MKLERRVGRGPDVHFRNAGLLADGSVHVRRLATELADATARIIWPPLRPTVPSTDNILGEPVRL